MLNFTAAGVVATPTALQLRVSADWVGRLAAGHALPSRALTDAEVAANLDWFVRGRVGPRRGACSLVVLTGQGILERPAIGEALVEARVHGLLEVVLHVGAEALALGRQGVAAQVDRLVITRPALGQLGGLAGLVGSTDAQLCVAVLLDEAGLAGLDAVVPALCAALARSERERVELRLSWPFTGEAPPALGRVLPALRAPLLAAGEAGLKVRVTGIPACLLGPWVPAGVVQLGRARNRYYVDADHQLESALSFFPDVVRFAKEDGCRFCAAEARCDGVVRRWLDQGLVPALVPMIEAEQGEG